MQLDKMIRRRILRRCSILLAFISLSFVFIWGSRSPNQIDKNSKSEWIAVRLSKDQEEYIDKRGVHVVVGHYIGDANNDERSQNLTDELINSNMFEPIPGEGKDGSAILIPPHLNGRMQQLFKINSFNLMASDRIPLNRTLPDMRKKSCRLKNIDIRGLPKTSVIIVFHNEAWSTLLRTVHSVINRSPTSLLQEIILVDDASTRKFLGKVLNDYVSKLPVPVKLLRAKKRGGLIKARLMGARDAQGQILTFLDAHCECTIGWLESLVVRVAENRRRVVCPIIDIISDNTFAYVRSFELHRGAFNWNMQFRWFTPDATELKKIRKDPTHPLSTPVMAGGLFAMDKNYFFEIGAYDEQMEIWGGENLELSFRVWQCGGSVEIDPCSHVGHIFRKSSPYSFPGGIPVAVYGNLARVALVWMDEWKEFYFKFNPEAEAVRDRQAVRSRLKLREQLNCHSFKWYLENIWPHNFLPNDDRFFGRIKHKIQEKCLEKPVAKGIINQPSGLVGLTTCFDPPVLIQMFVMDLVGFNNGSSSKGSPIMTDDSLCLDIASKENLKNKIVRVKIMPCTGSSHQSWLYNAQMNSIKHLSTDLCLDIPEDLNNGLTLNSCNNYPSQQWIMESVPWK